MIKLLAVSTAFLCLGSQTNNPGVSTATPINNTTTKSIYDFKVEALDGGSIDFTTFKGKKLLIVNTASECGYTPQYEGLEKLYKTYKDKLVIVGFPANNFGG
ncbi:MAG: glutathione peroxidase, partial [Ferruginibacter sp.]|nr:glutathione peroxidase [Ferruginibacter sp.]